MRKLNLTRKNLNTRFFISLIVRVFLFILITGQTVAAEDTGFKRSENSYAAAQILPFGIDEKFLSISYDGKGVDLERDINCSFLKLLRFDVLKLAMNIGYDETSSVKMNSVKLKSSLGSTFVDAVYDPDKDALELSMSNAVLNRCLADGMQLQFKADPLKKSGAVVLVMPL